MMAERISAVLDELSTTTDQLMLTANRLDLDRMEAVVAVRQEAIARLHELVDVHPEAFTQRDLERLRTTHAQGKLALEKLLETRRNGWITELSRKEHVIKSFAQSGTPSRCRSSR